MQSSKRYTLTVNQTHIELVQGDITKEETDAIVNAANESLLGGGGVDGAIHRAAGPRLLEETRLLGGCRTGDAKITDGYNLKAHHVIHAVGPVYSPRDPKVPELLASAYRRSLEIAHAHSLKSIAFPAISCGVYGYPMREAASIGLKEVIHAAQNGTSLERVRFVLFTTEGLETFADVLEKTADTLHL